MHRRSLLVAALPLAGCAVPALRIDDSRRSRAQDSRVLFIVLHYTEGGFERSLRTLTEGEVSAHYLVSDESPPRVLRLVDENRRAWHAGFSSWQQHAGLNASSIGIEIVNRGGDASRGFAPYAPAQIDTVIALVRDIMQRHAVRPEHVLGHSDIAPQRKLDPGPAFPWQRLADAGLVRWPDAARAAAARAAFELQPPDTAWWQQALAQLGYRVPQSGQLETETRNVIAAFQMKYRPSRYDGEPDAESAALLQALLP